MTKVVIFDCDGVMFDSKGANMAFYNHLLERLHLPPLSQEEIAYVHASSAGQAMRYLLERRGYKDEADSYQELIKGIDYRPFIRLMKMEPHLKDVLRRLPPEIKRAISTNRSYSIGDVLRYHGLEGEFDLVVSALDVKNPKPHPDSLLKVISHFSIEPEEAIFVGDTLNDQEASRRAGVPFVAYKNPSLKAHYHIDDLRQLLEIIKEKGA